MVRSIWDLRGNFYQTDQFRHMETKYIDPSLAKRIRRAYIESLDLSWERFRKLKQIESMRHPYLKLSTKKAFDKKVARLRHIVEHAGLIYYEFTVKQANRFLWACLFLKREKSTSQDDSKGMTPTGHARVEALTLHFPPHIRQDPMSIRVSAHAIDRVIQRMGLVELPIKPGDIRAVNTEISQSLIWAAASFFIFGKININESERFTLILPSQHGFFLAQFSIDPVELSLITYVNKDESWPEQKEAFKVLEAVKEEQLAFLAGDILARYHIQAEHSAVDDEIFRCWRDYGWRIREKIDRPKNTVVF